MTDPKIMPPPESFNSMAAVPEGRNTVEVSFGDDNVIFHMGVPLCVVSGKVVYFPDMTTSRAQSRVVNDTCPGLPHLRVATNEYDFVLATVLTKAGMGLIRAKKMEVGGE